MNDKQKYVLQQAIYIVVICFVFFLMFLGILRTFEINDYFGIEQYKYVKLYCEPKGFFGWGYDCDVIQYNKDIGNVPQDYNEYPIYNITFNETMMGAAT
jgi:hypothetical protein